MNQFVLHPEAYTDIDEIWEYIASDNPDAADRVLQEIYGAVDSLVAFLRRGHRRPDPTTRPLRFQVVRNYLIAYAPGEKPLVVIAVIHGRRNPHMIAAMLDQRE